MVKVYDVLFKFNDYPNVIFWRKLSFDSQVVETKLPVKHPVTGKMAEVVFAGASTRRQGIYKYKESTKNGQIIGG